MHHLAMCVERPQLCSILHDTRNVQILLASCIENLIYDVMK